MQKSYLVIVLILVVGVAAYFKIREETKETRNYITVKEYQAYSLDKPDSLEFCSEIIPLSDHSVQEKFDAEMYKLTYYRHNTGILIKRANLWFPRMEPIIERYNLPEDFKFVAVVESGLSNVVSSRGAAGFWQFLVVTGREMGLIIDDEIDERYNPLMATEAACGYLNLANKELGNWTNAVASYNCGITGMGRRLRVQKKESYYDLDLNKETGAYVYRIAALKQVYENLDKYGFGDYSDRRAFEEPHKMMGLDTSVASFDQVAKEMDFNFQAFRELNPWILTDAVHQKQRKLWLKVPSKQYSIDVEGDEVEADSLLVVEEDSLLQVEVQDSLDLSQDSALTTPADQKNELSLPSDSDAVEAHVEIEQE